MRGRGRLRDLPPQPLRARLGALRNLPPFLKLVWQTSPALTLGQGVLRILRALLPVITLYIGKLIIDEVVLLAGTPHPNDTLREWLDSGALDRIGWLLALEFVLAVGSDVLGRAISLLNGLLSERFSNETSLRLMAHAATLDLEDFEDSELQDRLQRARQQAAGRSSLIAQLFGQAQDVITIVSFAAGLLVFAPWLILMLAVALIPAFIGETHFNAQSYSLNFAWTPERRELDYVRQTGASVDTAKEVKIFGLNAFLIERYRTLSERFFAANRVLAIRRAGWGGALAAIGTLAYYIAYAYIVWRTLRGDFSIGDLTFLAGSFMRLRNLLENLLIGFSQVAGQALYLDDLFSFFEIEPEIVPPENPRPFPCRSSMASCSRTSAFAIQAPSAGPCATSTSSCVPEKSSRWSARTARQDHVGQAARAPLRSGRRSHPVRRARPARIRPVRAARQHRRHLSRLHALQLHRRRQHRRRPHRSARRSCASSSQPSAAWPMKSSASCPSNTTSCSASAFAPASICPAASGKRSPSRAPTCAMRSC